MPGFMSGLFYQSFTNMDTSLTNQGQTTPLAWLWRPIVEFSTMRTRLAPISVIYQLAGSCTRDVSQISAENEEIWQVFKNNCAGEPAFRSKFIFHSTYPPLAKWNPGGLRFRYRTPGHKGFLSGTGRRWQDGVGQT